MPPSGPGSARLASVESLLRDLGPRLRRAESPLEAPRRWPTGLAELDRLLGGGFPAGRIGEIAGPASSGRTSLLLRLLAATTAGGESVALVDGANAFDPASASGARTRCSSPARRPGRKSPQSSAFAPHTTVAKPR